MATVNMTAALDTSVLRQAIPEIVAFGRRTMVEQCVTSAAIIVLNAQKDTPFVAVSTIDSELDVEVTAVTKLGKPSRAKKPKYHKVSVAQGARVPLAVLIVMARTNLGSEYSKKTGNRWPLSLSDLPTGKGSGPARQAIIAQWISRMTLSRHSSTHFLQHGWAAPARALLSNPNFKGWASRGLRQTNKNSANRLDNSAMGSAIIDLAGDACVVMAENAVGEQSNEVLDAKRRQALIEHGSAPLQRAIDAEARAITGKIEDYLERGIRQKWPKLFE